MERLTKTYSDGSYGVADDLPCGENSYEFKDMLIKTLGEYEQLDEQGLLLKVHCKVGDIVYANAIKKNFITKCEVCRIEFVKYSHLGEVIYYVEPTACTCKGTTYKFYNDDFSDRLFFSEKEAEQALAKMESEVKVK